MTARAVSLLALLTALATGSAGAQTPPGVLPGSRVRVWSSDLPRRGLTARLEYWSADSVAVRRLTGRSGSREERRAIAAGSVTRLEVEVARTRREGARTWGLFGAVEGAGTGVLLGLFAAGLGGRYYPRGTDRPGVHPLYFAVPVSVAIGGAGGAAVGALFPGKRWRRVVPPPRS